MTIDGGGADTLFSAPFT